MTSRPKAKHGAAAGTKEAAIGGQGRVRLPGAKVPLAQQVLLESHPNLSSCSRWLLSPITPSGTKKKTLTPSS